MTSAGVFDDDVISAQISVWLTMSRQLLLPVLWLTEEKLLEIAPSSQCLRKAYDLVKCGDVFNIQISMVDGFYDVVGWVHSEKASAPIYRVSVKLSSEKLIFYSCVCKGSVSLPSGVGVAQCKHVFAILVGLEAIRNTSPTAIPKRFKRAGMDVYARAPERVRAKVEVELTWSDILVRLESPIPKTRSGGGKVKLISEKLSSASEEREKKKVLPLFMQILISMDCKCLREECIRRSLPSSGNKDLLIQRLSPSFENLFPSPSSTIPPLSESAPTVLPHSEISSRIPLPSLAPLSDGGGDTLQSSLLNHPSTSLSLSPSHQLPQTLPLLSDDVIVEEQFVSRKRLNRGEPLDIKRVSVKKKRYEVEG